MGNETHSFFLLLFTIAKSDFFSLRMKQTMKQKENESQHDSNTFSILVQKNACLEIGPSMDHLFSLLGLLRKWRRQNLDRIKSRLTEAKQKRKIIIKLLLIKKVINLQGKTNCFEVSLVETAHGWFQQKPLWSWCSWPHTCWSGYSGAFLFNHFQQDKKII